MNRMLQFSHVLAAKEVDFFLLPVYEHFFSRQYHRETCSADWDTDNLHKDFSRAALASSISKQLTSAGAESFTTTKLLLRLEPDLFVGVYRTDYCNEVQVFAPTAGQAQDKMKSLLSRYVIQPKLTPHFYLVSWNGIDLQLRPVPLASSNRLEESNLELHYGSGFSSWHDVLVSQLIRRKNGLTILHGDPGTGKTTYLRHLIVSLNRTHRFIFLPLDQGRLLSELSSVDFWREQRLHDPERKLVVIMEDAEEFLLERTAAQNNARAADLLNVSDGLMGDYLQLHLICTINCPLDALDKAITRSGRLLGYRQFPRLSRTQAQRIADAEKLQLPDQPDYSLAEIYNGQSVFADANPERRLGFAA